MTTPVTPHRPTAVVVTGATSGIGRAVALELHRRGELVYATGRDEAALAEPAPDALRRQLEVGTVAPLALVQALLADPQVGSRYAAVADAVAGRARASQEGATPVEEVARSAVDAILAPRPRRTVPLARGGRSLAWFGRLAPAWLRDRVRTRRFDLDALRAGRAPRTRARVGTPWG